MAAAFAFSETVVTVNAGKNSNQEKNIMKDLKANLVLEDF